ncbi:MAG: hypothetical protein AB7O30_00645 [Dehalococcoidia bacterium]
MPFFMSAIAVTLLTGSAILGVAAIAAGSAAPKPACLTRAWQPEEQQLADLHTPWRYLYVPGTDPTHPLEGSAVLRATALGIAHDLADGEIVASDVTATYLAQRAIACGYPADVAVGGRGIATGTDSASEALVLMTSEQWGSAAGIRVPAWVDGQPMRCIGVAHASEGEGDGWVIIIMAADNTVCPQGLSSAVEPYDGGTPTATPSFPFTFPTKTPTPTKTATPTATPTPSLHKLFLGVAKD